MRDTSKRFPVGFEHLRRNIFDPEEDEVGTISDDSTESEEERSRTSIMEAAELDYAAKEDEPAEGSDGRSRKKKAKCAREGCRKKPRFDSLLCSDACGVSVLESDLLRTFWDSSDIHPSVLRN